MEYPWFLKCLKCGAKNRIIKNPVGYIQKCRQCGNVEYYDEKRMKQISLQNRSLCPVEGCEGLLDSDGYCEICGEHPFSPKKRNSRPPATTTTSGAAIVNHSAEEKHSTLQNKVILELGTKRCPYCAEEIQAEAIKCKHCGEWLDQPNSKTEPISMLETKATKSHGSWKLAWLIVAVIVIWIAYSFFALDSEIMVHFYGNHWKMNLILSFILTWAVGLLPPLLIRFSIVKRPISRKWSIVIAGFLWVFNLFFFIALDSQSRTHGTLALIAIISFWVLRKGSTQSA